MLELLAMRSTFLLPSLPVQLLSGMVGPGRVLSVGLIELNSVFMLK